MVSIVCYSEHGLAKYCCSKCEYTRYKDKVKEVLQETLHYPVVVNVKVIWPQLNPTDVVRLAGNLNIFPVLCIGSHFGDVR